MIVLSGKQNMALCGHHDDQHHQHHLEQLGTTKFLALLQFRVEAGGLTLKNHLDNAPRDARCTYTQDYLPCVDTEVKRLLESVLCSQQLQTLTIASGEWL